MNVGFAPGVGGTGNDGAAESVVFKQCVSELTDRSTGNIAANG